MDLIVTLIDAPTMQTQAGDIALNEDSEIAKRLVKGYKLKFEVDLESVFQLIPEINITQLANSNKINPGLLRQYVSGTKRTSEKQTEKVMKAIQNLTIKLTSTSISV